MAQRILITGADGFLGARLAAYYEKHYEVVRAGRRTAKGADSQGFASTYRSFDLTDQQAVNRIFEQEKPDIVLHCGAISDVGACERSPKLSRSINVDGTVHLAKACKAMGGRLIFMSSDQIYMNETGTVPNRESVGVSPVNVYGRDKQSAEELALQAAPDTVCLRLTWMYDLPVKGLKTNPNLLMKLLHGLITNELLELPVYDFRGITWAGEVVSNMEAAWKLPGGVYNYGSENDCSTYETALAWLQMLAPGREDLLRRNESRFAGRPRNLLIDTENIQKRGIRFETSQAGLIRCFKEYGIELNSGAYGQARERK